MAETVHLFLQVNNQPVTGESTQLSLGRQGSIECLSYVEETRSEGREGARFDAVRITKRIDRSSAPLAQALLARAPVQAVFRFYRPNPAGDGTTQQYFTVPLDGGRVVSIHRQSPDVLDPALQHRPPIEAVAFSFEAITWTYEDGGSATGKVR